MCCMVIRVRPLMEKFETYKFDMSESMLYSEVEQKCLLYLLDDWNEKSKELKVKHQGVATYVQIKILHL